MITLTFYLSSLVVDIAEIRRLFFYYSWGSPWWLSTSPFRMGSSWFRSAVSGYDVISVSFKNWCKRCYSATVSVRVCEGMEFEQILVASEWFWLKDVALSGGGAGDRIWECKRVARCMLEWGGWKLCKCIRNWILGTSFWCVQTTLLTSFKCWLKFRRESTTT